MRITSQNMDVSVQPNVVKNLTSVATPSKEVDTKSALNEAERMDSAELQQGEKEIPKEKIQKAVDSINDFLEVNKKAAKFVLHDGLDKYFVRLVDAETEEVIKEIPPEKLLNAFYEMQKLAGMIVDEKI